MKNEEFMKSLRRRGMSLTKLAEPLRTTHSHLSQVFNGSRGGAYTRKHIVRYLTAAETKLLGWLEVGEMPEPPEMTEAEAEVKVDKALAGIVPRETLSQQEHAEKKEAEDVH